jgi:L-lysine 6-oxidase
VTALDRASVGNCVGWPMCPGIEVTWSLLNPNLYEAPYRIRHRHDETFYSVHGLSPSEDETADGLGCEPGDLTKRMAIPWQADFFQCTVQYVNFTDPDVNKEGGIPKPPTYYAYWWPPQSPMFVLSGDQDAPSQAETGLPAGYQVYYPRGVNSFAQMIVAWPYLGFVVNQNTSDACDAYPYFVERERDHRRFVSTSVAVGAVDNFVNATDGVFWPMYFLRSDAETTMDAHQTAALVADPARIAEVPYGTEPARGPILAPGRGPHRHAGRRR